MDDDSTSGSGYNVIETIMAFDDSIGEVNVDCLVADVVRSTIRYITAPADDL